MAVKLRLARHGAKKRPFYRIVAASAAARRDGRFLEQLGTYDPAHKPAGVILKRERIRYWLDKGAEPTDTVASIFRRHLEGVDTIKYASGPRIEPTIAAHFMCGDPELT